VTIAPRTVLVATFLFVIAGWIAAAWHLLG
jgi:hypothetical protein